MDSWTNDLPHRRFRESSLVRGEIWDQSKNVFNLEQKTWGKSTWVQSRKANSREIRKLDYNLSFNPSI